MVSEKPFLGKSLTGVSENLSTEERKESKVVRLEGLAGDPDVENESDDGFDII